MKDYLPFVSENQLLVDNPNRENLFHNAVLQEYKVLTLNCYGIEVSRETPLNITYPHKHML